MSASATEMIDLTIFHKRASLSRTSRNLNQSLSIKRILTLIKYYQMLNVNTDKDDQNIFINFINTIYTVSGIIMDYHQLKEKFADQIHDIMKIAKDVYKIKVHDITTCPHSSRLYRVEDKTAKLHIFDNEDKESVFKVVMDIIDGIYHFIFHIYILWFSPWRSYSYSAVINCTNYITFRFYCGLLQCEICMFVLVNRFIYHISSLSSEEFIFLFFHEE